ncbi:thermonuclease family protein [Nocardioides terrigena]|uniref:thermonuclease family protein n=1 Tax=Nocardioides terrigena TaxID=424797 RepID=UPI000D32027F|nr:thermonuclease family protein [Nocardioides terrigena]
MRRFLSTLIAIAAVVAALLTTTAPAQAVKDLDCGDFPNQAAAQTNLNNNPSDPNGLDSEGDGRACESLPCPCLGAGGGGGTSTPPPNNNGGTSNTGNTSGSGPVKRNVGNVVKVTDGDTLKVRIRGIGIRDVRILGIDTPEKYGRRECGAVKATESMESLAPVGSTVVLFSDPSQADKDRYQRLLRYVERKDRDVGRAQIFTGHSKVYVYRNDPVRRTANYRVAQKQAMNRSAGLWSTCWF